MSDDGGNAREPVAERGEQLDEPTPLDRARSYDADIRAAVPGYETLHETVAALLRLELGDEARILLVGVGAGEELTRLAPANPGWRFTGEDPSPAMLAAAREKIAADGLADRVELVEGQVQDLPISEPFDAATAILVQHFLPDDGAKLELLREIAARLKPGAPLILANMHGDLSQPAAQRLYQAWKQRQLARCVPAADAEAMFQGLPQVVSFVSEARHLALLREAGFVDVEPVFKAFMIGGWLARFPAATPAVSPYPGRVAPRQPVPVENAASGSSGKMGRRMFR